MQFLDIHTHRQYKDAEIRSIRSLSLTGIEPIVIPSNEEVSVGLHPWFATMEHFEEDYSKLCEAANEPNVRMLGECGLDRIKGDTLAHQQVILKQQLKLADQLSKPVILHCVKSFAELTAVQQEMRISVPLIIHGFNKHEELGKQLINKGFYLSFGKAILNANSGAANLLKQIDTFFLETDDGDCNIHEIYEAAANLKNCSVDVLKALIFANWKKIKLI